MDNKKKRNLFLLAMLFFLIWKSSIYGQEEKKSPLTEVIVSLEENFDIRFSFALSDVENLSIKTPNYEQNLERILVYLENNTPLTYRKIDARYIVITPNELEFIRICGKLIDSQSGEPLTGVTIQLENSTHAVVSNINGEFSMQSIPTNSNLSLRHLGYNPQTIKAQEFKSSSPCKTLSLFASTEELKEIVLQDIFAKGILKTKTGEVKLNVENFGNLPGLTEPDVLQMIQTLPGIISVNETISNISIRGGTTDENLILWDDIKMYQNGHFFGMISGFNPYLTKDVSLYKNGTPARYGESVSGVVAMQSSDEFIETHQLGMQLNMINFGAFAKVRVNNKLVFHASGRRSFTDLLKSPAYNQLYNKVFQDTKITNLQTESGSGSLRSEEDFLFYDFSLKAIYKSSDKDQLSFNFLNIHNDLNFTETFSTLHTENSETSELNQSSLAGGVSWRRQWSENINTKAMAYATFYSLDASNLDIFSNQEFIQTNQVLETGSKIDFNWNINSTNTFSMGYQFSETGISNRQEVNTPLFRNYIKNVLLSHALYFNHSLEIPSTSTTVFAGLRANHFSKFKKSLLEPRLNIHQKLGNGFAVETAFEQKSQTVTQRIDFQSDFLGVEKRRWVLANDQDVPILTSNQFSISFLYQKYNWLLQVEAYIKNVKGITTANQGFQNQLQFVRTNGSYKTQGMEVIVNKKMNDWSAWISYTYATNNYLFDTFSPSTFPHNVDIRHQGTLASSYTFNKLKITAGLNWHTGTPYTLPLSENAVETSNGTSTIVYGDPNSERNTYFLRADLSAEYSFKIGSKLSAKINAAVLNLSNRKNILNTYFIIEEEESSEPIINRIEQVSLGLTPNIHIQVLF